MTAPIVLTDNWALGMVSDTPPHLMKPNSAISIVNLIPNNEQGSLELRGAWGKAYTAHSDFTYFSASSTSLTGITYAQFPDGARLVAVDQSGRIMSISTAGVGTLHVSSGFEAVNHSPFFYQYGTTPTLILPGSTGTVFPYFLTSSGGTVTATQAANPFPKATFGFAWPTGPYAVFGNGGDPSDSYTIHSNRLWFSDLGALTYTTANNGYVDFPDAIVGGLPVTQGALIWSNRKVYYLTGTTPPNASSSSPSGDLERLELYPQGTIDGRSVCSWNGYAIWINATGVFMTDGTSLVNLTDQAGLNYLWRETLYGFTSGWTAAAGIYQNYYIVTICNASGVEQVTWCFNLTDRTGFQLAGFPAAMYANVINGIQASTFSSPEDLIFASNAAPYAGRLQPCFSEGTAAGKDPNGVVVSFNLFTALFVPGLLAKTRDASESRMRRLWVWYYWDNTGGYNDVVQFKYTTKMIPAQGISANMTSVTAPPAGVGSVREPVFVNNKGRWIALQITNPTGGNGVKNFSLFGLDLEAFELSGSRSG